MKTILTHKKTKQSHKKVTLLIIKLADKYVIHKKKMKKFKNKKTII